MHLAPFRVLASHLGALFGSLRRVAVLQPSRSSALIGSPISQCTRFGSHAYAAQHDYVVLTDFSAILAATHGEKPSVVQIRTEDVSPQVIGSLVTAALRHMEPELQAGALLTIDSRRTRVRLLPLISKE